MGCAIIIAMNIRLVIQVLARLRQLRSQAAWPCATIESHQACALASESPGIFLFDKDEWLTVMASFAPSH